MNGGVFQEEVDILADFLDEITVWRVGVVLVLLAEKALEVHVHVFAHFRDQLEDVDGFVVEIAFYQRHLIEIAVPLLVFQ